MTDPAAAQNLQKVLDAGPPVADRSDAQIANEDIIVTARKRAERNQDVPIAIKVFTTEQLERYGTRSFSQISNQSPTLQIGQQAGVGENVITLRGIGTVASSRTNDQSVALNIDGIQVSNSAALNLGLHDLGQVEILKGPQALFYGKNSPAGVISLVSNVPGRSLEAMARGGYEFEARQKYAEAVISTPLTPTLGVRIAGYYSNEDGYFHNDAKPIASYVVPASIGGKPGEATTPGIGTSEPRGPGKKEYFVRGTLAYKSPDGVVDAKLRVSYNNVAQLGGYGYLSQMVACQLGAPKYVVLLNTTGSRDCSLDRNVNVADFSPDVMKLDPAFKRVPFVDTDQFLSSLAVDVAASDKITISSVSGYYKFHSKVDANFGLGDQDYIAVYNDAKIEQLSEELRLATKLGGPVNFMIGGYYQHSTVSSINKIIFGNPFSRINSGGVLTGTALYVNAAFRQVTDAISGFGQVLFDVTKQVQFTVGGRYSHEAKKGFGHENPSAYNATGYDIVLTPNQASFNNFSPEATLSYKPVANLTFYGAYRQGFKSGGFDLSTLVGARNRPNAGKTTYGQETVRGGEIGAKGSLADRQIIFDFDLYKYNFKGLQGSAFDTIAYAYVFTNAGSAVTKGAEASLEFRPAHVRGLGLHTTISYTDAHYIQFINAPCYGGQSQAAGCNGIAGVNAMGGLQITPATPTTTGNAQNLSGKPLPRAPKWSSDVGMNFDQEIGGGKALDLAFDAVYTDGFFSLAEQDPRAWQSAAWRYNASIRLRGRNEKWELALIGSNLSNVLRSVSGQETNAAGTGTNNAQVGDLYGSSSEPRAVSLQATVKF